MIEHGYSRDHRPDCKQVVIALIVNAESDPETPTVNFRDRKRTNDPHTSITDPNAHAYWKADVRRSRWPNGEPRALPGASPPDALCPQRSVFHVPAGG